MEAQTQVPNLKVKRYCGCGGGESQNQKCWKLLYCNYTIVLYESISLDELILPPTLPQAREVIFSFDVAMLWIPPPHTHFTLMALKNLSLYVWPANFYQGNSMYTSCYLGHPMCHSQLWKRPDLETRTGDWLFTPPIPSPRVVSIISLVEFWKQVWEGVPSWYLSIYLYLYLYIYYIYYIYIERYNRNIASIVITCLTSTAVWARLSGYIVLVRCCAGTSNYHVQYIYHVHVRVDVLRQFWLE